MLELNQQNTQRALLLNFDYSNDKEVRFIPKDKPLGTTTAYLSIKELADISEKVNDAGALLMTYYFRKVRTPKFDFFDDGAVSLALRWSVRKAQATRLALVKAGWLKKITYVQPTTKSKITVFYVGKEMCDMVMTPEEYTASKANLIKQQEVVLKMRTKIMEHYSLDTWEQVIASKSEEEILSLVDSF